MRVGGGVCGSFLSSLAGDRDPDLTVLCAGSERSRFRESEWVCSVSMPVRRVSSVEQAEGQGQGVKEAMPGETGCAKLNSLAIVERGSVQTRETLLE